MKNKHYSQAPHKNKYLDKSRCQKLNQPPYQSRTPKWDEACRKLDMRWKREQERRKMLAQNCTHARYTIEHQTGDALVYVQDLMCLDCGATCTKYVQDGAAEKTQWVKESV